VHLVVQADGEAVRLVANALQQEQGLRIPRQAQGFGPVGEV